MAHSLCLCIIFRVIGVFFAVKRRAQANRSFAREKRIRNDGFFLSTKLRHTHLNVVSSHHSLPQKPIFLIISNRIKKGNR